MCGLERRAVLVDRGKLDRLSVDERELVDRLRALKLLEGLAVAPGSVRFKLWLVRQPAQYVEPTPLGWESGSGRARRSPSGHVPEDALVC